MPQPIVGLHHVTAIASDPQRNLDFYCEVLGLRFVKRTVNFDDPGSYHFYFGDDIGSPGSILTFFAWPQATRGHVSTGETSAVAFSVSASSLHFWEQRLLAAGSPVERAGERFGNPVLCLGDPDGMRIELVGSDNSLPVVAPRTSDIAAEHAIRGFDGVTLCEAGFAPAILILGASTHLVLRARHEHVIARQMVGRYSGSNWQITVARRVRSSLGVFFGGRE
jgi:glyoxalase family protein